jgi:hypothetical protein
MGWGIRGEGKVAFQKGLIVIDYFTKTRPRSPRGRKYRQAALIAGVLAVACLGASVGDVLYVNSVSMPIREGKFAFDKVVATAVQGESVKVDGVEGKWLKVKYAPPAADASKPSPMFEGYVYEQALSARQVAAATTGPTGQATAVAGSAAGKGLLLNAGRYATAKGLSPDPFYKMMADASGSVTDAAFDAFTKAGKIGPYKPNPAATKP